jgi:hypothetical protein
MECAKEVREHSDSEESTDSLIDFSFQECDKERSSHIKTMLNLEKEFGFMKNELYALRVQSVDREVEALTAGNNKAYQERLVGLEERRKYQNECASIERKCQETILRRWEESEESSANQNFENNKANLFERIKNDTEQKIFNLKVDKTDVEFHLDEWLEETSRGKGGQAASGQKESHLYDLFELPKVDKPVTVNGPCIVYMLKKEEIAEDWQRIRRAMNTPTPRLRDKFASIEDTVKSQPICS